MRSSAIQVWTSTATGRRRSISRFAWIRSGALALLALFAAAVPAQAEAPGAYMQRVMNELIAAQRSGGSNAFATVLRRHMDAPAIGLRALGPHAATMAKSDRPSYYSAMINFISKYVAKESSKYRVTSAVVSGQGVEAAGGTEVDTRISVGGTPYDVRWRLVRSGGGYKVRDALVVGFSATSQLETLFQNYISENGNNPRALVVALNRY